MSTSSPSPKNEIDIFKCDQHSEYISTKLLNFYEKKELFDTVLIAGSNCINIQSHRMVLSAFSDYFLEIFRDSQTPAMGNVVELKEIEASTLELVIDFMYWGWMELSLETVESILRTAAFLKMKVLLDGCCDFIEKYLNDNNCLKWLQIAKELSLSELQDKSLKYTCTHFEEVGKGTNFLGLSEAELKHFLFTNNRSVDFEKHLFLCLIAWFEHDKANRKSQLFRLLPMIRYQFLPPKFIVENRRSLCKTAECFELISSWLQWHLSPETRSNEQLDNNLNPVEKEGNLTVIRTLKKAKKIEIHTYNSEKDSWSFKKQTPLWKKKDDCPAIVIDAKLYIVGGLKDWVTQDSVECLDLKTLEWSALPPLQRGRYNGQLANLNGNLCVFGGHEYVGKAIFMDFLEIFDFSTHEWRYEYLPSKPSDYSSIAVQNGILYVFDILNDCLQTYDILSNQWTSKKLNSDITHVKLFTLAVVGQFAYVMGGIYDYEHPMSFVYQYDLVNDWWYQMEDLPDDHCCVLTTVFNNKLVICGRLNNTTSVEEYDPGTKTWTSLGSLSWNCKKPVNLCILPLKL